MHEKRADVGDPGIRLGFRGVLCYNCVRIVGVLCRFLLAEPATDAPFNPLLFLGALRI